MARKNRAELRKVITSIKLPFLNIDYEVEANETEQLAAWALYIELVTRIAVQPLKADEGLVSEALSSLHSLFPTTREILKKAGPDVGCSKDSVGGIAIAVLNERLRPVLAKWHPKLKKWEDEQASPANVVKATFAEETQLRQELEILRQDLVQYAEALAKIAGVKE
jgi:hypothetical protein